MNSVNLIGNLTKDPTLTKTQNGLSVCRFTVAVKRDYTKNDESDFIQCIAWKQSADYLTQYGHKGDKVSVQGQILTGSYDGNDGKKVYTTDVNASKVTIEFTKHRSDAKEQEDPKKEEQSITYNDFETGQLVNINSDDLPF